MTTGSAVTVREKSRANRWTGVRKLTPQLLFSKHGSECFNGLPETVISPGQLLAAFKEAAPYLGLAVRHVHAVDWFFRFTQPQDWERGALPIVWPSSAEQQAALNLSTTRVKALNRDLIEAGLINPKDSPSGKRYGRRYNNCAREQIIEAYGFDLSPLATRHAEFRRIADEARAERDEMKRLRRRATIARKGINQILEIVADRCLTGQEWSHLAEESQNLGRVLRTLKQLEEMAFGVARLERRWHEARGSLARQLAEQRDAGADRVNTAPKGFESGPLNTYKPAFYAQGHTVVAAGTVVLRGVENVREKTTIIQSGNRAGASSGFELTKTSLRLTPGELVDLTPNLKVYLPQASPSWPDVIDALGGPIRHKFDIPQSLWGDACLTMGRVMAAIAIALVSTKPMEHFRSTPGAYFRGMMEKAKAGQLDLERSILGLRYAKAGAAKRDDARTSPSHVKRETIRPQSHDE